MTDALFIITPEKKITKVNSAALKLVATTEKMLFMKTIDELFEHPVDLFQDSGWKQLLNSGQGKDHNNFLLSFDGECIPVCLSISPIKDGTGILSAISVFAMNLSDKHELDARVIQTEKLSALRELASGITHELNQPLNTMKLICQSILRDLKKERYTITNLDADLSDVVKQIDRMADLIQHIRLYSKKGDGDFQTVVDVNQLIKNVLQFTSRLFTVDSIELTKNLGEPAPFVKCEPVLLEEVILSLLGNARDAVNKSSCAQKKIMVTTIKEGNEVIIEITDNGYGVPEKIKNRIFQPFFTTKKSSECTGLGLSLAKKVIEEHHGRIDFTSKTATGSTFRVYLPA